ncbi:MAG: hypothetical protein JWP57_2415 [Spirosoma sp.]|nr:hypothetical protein [Spirosoma sp.]
MGTVSAIHWIKAQKLRLTLGALALVLKAGLFLYCVPFYRRLGDYLSGIFGNNRGGILGRGFAIGCARFLRIAGRSECR